MANEDRIIIIGLLLRYQEIMLGNRIIQIFIYLRQFENFLQRREVEAFSYDRNVLNVQLNLSYNDKRPLAQRLSFLVPV